MRAQHMPEQSVCLRQEAGSHADNLPLLQALPSPRANAICVRYYVSALSCESSCVGLPRRLAIRILFLPYVLVRRPRS